MRYALGNVDNLLTVLVVVYFIKIVFKNFP